MAVSPGIGGVSRPLKEGAGCLYSSKHMKRTVLQVLLSCQYDSNASKLK